MKEEIYKDIPNYKGLYQVSNFGNVKSIFNEKLLKPYVRKTGYVHVLLSKDGKRKCYTIHKLVMLAFVGESNGLDVNHIDGNKQNNKLDNLEYCTRKENSKHAWKTGLCKYTEKTRETARNHCKTVGQNNRKPVIQKDLNGNFIKRWNSIIEAGKTLNINRANITSCCKKNGTYKTAGGFIWEYDNLLEILSKGENK